MKLLFPKGGGILFSSVLQQLDSIIFIWMPGELPQVQLEMMKVSRSCMEVIGGSHPQFLKFLNIWNYQQIFTFIFLLAQTFNSTFIDKPERK